jgi:hypothetical protein
MAVVLLPPSRHHGLPLPEDHVPSRRIESQRASGILEKIHLNLNQPRRSRELIEYSLSGNESLKGAFSLNANFLATTCNDL